MIGTARHLVCADESHRKGLELAEESGSDESAVTWPGLKRAASPIHSSYVDLEMHDHHSYSFSVSDAMLTNSRMKKTCQKWSLYIIHSTNTITR